MKRYLIVILFLIFVVIGNLTGFEPGMEIGMNFVKFFMTMIKFLPFVFILNGIFEVWVKKEVIERHLGEASGVWGYVWALAMAGTTIGGIYVAFPVAATLHKKGARLSVIFTYISSTAVCKIPMTLFEASYLGAKFSAIRILTALPMVIFISTLFEKHLKKSNYTIGGED